jgi:hypothetical protein
MELSEVIICGYYWEVDGGCLSFIAPHEIPVSYHMEMLLKRHLTSFPPINFLVVLQSTQLSYAPDHTCTLQYPIRASGSRARLTLLKKSLAVLRKVDRLAITRPHQS